MEEEMTDFFGRAVTRRRLLQGSAGGVIAMSALPALVRAETRPIKFGQITVSSGRVAQLGITSRNAIQMEIDDFNRAGGLNGRMVELVDRDSKGKPDEAARLTRELIESEGCAVILDCEGSGGSFAVHEVIRNSPALCMHCISETTQLTADPKLRSWNSFRTARQALHDSIVGGLFAARLANAKGLTRWATIAADYAYGREATPEFMGYVRNAGAKVQLVAEAWPKLYQPDYTENITKILQARPEALFCGLWGGDLVAFIDQGNLFNLFDKVEVFSIHMADYTTLSAIRNLPGSGVYSSNRYLSTFPGTPANARWSDAYAKRFKSLPTNWSWEAAAGTRFVLEAMRKTQGVEPAALAAAMRGMKIDSPVGGPDGTLFMRAEDQTIINYALGWGRITSKEPFLVDIEAADWSAVLVQEEEWKAGKGYI
jgi:branched-chain amino acid transport system substrate-binding protein